RLGAMALGPVRRVSWRTLRLFAVKRAPHAAHEPETITARMLGARLMLIGRANPIARFDEDRGAGNHEKRELPSMGSPAVGPACTASLPGMCGKPRKLSVLANLARHVSTRLSQPA